MAGAPDACWDAGTGGSLSTGCRMLPVRSHTRAHTNTHYRASCIAAQQADAGWFKQGNGLIRGSWVFSNSQRFYWVSFLTTSNSTRLGLFSHRYACVTAINCTGCQMHAWRGRLKNPFRNFRGWLLWLDRKTDCKPRFCSHCRSMGPIQSLLKSIGSSLWLQ